MPPDLKTLEERISVPLFGDEPGLKGVSSFVSNIKRENRLLIDSALPSPDQYYPVISPKYMIRGRVQDGFGTDATREPLYHRDIAKSPYKNPTCLESPDPGSYKFATDFKKLRPEDETITANGLPVSLANMPQPSAFHQHKH